MRGLWKVQWPETGLREVGCSESAISEALEVMGAETFDSTAFMDLLHRCEEDVRAVLLATIGRGISSGVRRLAFSDPNVRIALLDTSNEINALSVNLNSNSNVVELEICGTGGSLDPRDTFLWRQY